MSNGWIKLHRKIMDNPVVCKDAETFAIWIYMLLSAAHDGKDVVFKGERFSLKPGQFISSTRSIADKLGVSKDKTHRVINCLKSATQIATQTSTKNTLFTVLNWDKYQNRATRNETQVRHDCDTTATQNKNERMKEYIYIDSNESICPTVLKKRHEQEEKEVEYADVELLPCTNNDVYRCPKEKYDEWSRLYPDVNIEQEFRSMRAWLNEHPKKTLRGMGRFISSWLNRSQNRGGKGKTQNQFSLSEWRPKNERK